MKMKSLRVILAGSLAIIFMIVGVILVLRPAIWDFFAIGSPSEIGEVIGGVAAVIIGLANALLLYLTLQNQITKGEREDIESHFKRLEDMIVNFSFKKYVEESGVTGTEALHSVANELERGEGWSQELMVGSRIIDYLWLVLAEFESFEQRLKRSRLDQEEAVSLQRRLLLLYSANLSIPFSKISGSEFMLDRHPDFSRRAQEFESRVDELLKSLGP